MLVSIPLLLAAATLPPIDLSLEEKLLAVVPEEVELKGEPLISPDGKSFPNVVRVIWSPDGRRVAHSGIAGGKLRPVVDGELLEEYDFVDYPLWSEDGQHVAFRVGRTKSRSQETWWTLIDGEEKNETDWIGSVALTNEGEPVFWDMPGARLRPGDGAYTREPMYFRTPFKKGRLWKDGKALGLPRVAKDGKWCATLASPRDGEWTVLVVSKRGERDMKLKESWITDYAISPDGKKVAVVVPSMDAGLDSLGGMPPMPGGMMPGMGSSVLKSGKKTFGKEYDTVGVPVFTPDGKRLVYKVDRDGMMGLAVDDRLLEETNWAFVKRPVFSEDGKWMAYAVNRAGIMEPFWRMSEEGDYAKVDGGEWTIFARSVDGKKKGLRSWGPFEAEVMEVAISGDGKQVAWSMAEGGKEFVRWGDQVSEKVDEVGRLRWAEKGEALAYGAREDRELWWRVMRPGEKE